MSSYPPPGPPYRGDWRLQRRLYRDQARAQRDLYRAQMRANRRSSIVGPLLVIAIGVVFLLVQTGRLQSVRLWDWYGKWWPTLLIGLGVILLLEWTVDQWLTRRSAHDIAADPNYRLTPPRRVIGSGIVFLLVLLIGAGVVFSAHRHSRGSNFFAPGLNLNPDNLEEFLGDKHESDQTLVQTIPANASVSIDNPRGDVVVSGTSDDGQLHLTAHKHVFSRSDADADSKARQLSPRLDATGTHLVISVPPLQGARADLNILLPPSTSLAITANRGDVRVNFMKSAVALIANHGDANISAISGAVSAHVNSGSASFAAHSITGGLSIEGHGNDLTLSDVSGPVAIHGDFFGTTHLERIHGGVKFHTSRTDLQLGSLLGDLEISPNADLSVNQAAGPLALNTRNRNITLDHVSGDVSVTNHNGSVDLTSALPFGNINVQNRNGSITLTLPDKANFTLNAETTDGDLSNDFSLPSQGTNNRKTLTGTVGKGGSMIRINTSQGDISIKKASIVPSRLSPPAQPAMPALSVRGQNGGSVAIGKDGVRVSTGDNGSSVIIGKDGLRITANADGSSTYNGKNGTHLTESTDGSKIFLDRNGTRFTQNADGSQIYIANNGTRITTGTDGSQTAVGSGGRILSESEAQDTLRRAQDEIRQTEQKRDLERQQHEP
jgi:DUF4097 and DUF4098 domain-containing protein YvlB